MKISPIPGTVFKVNPVRGVNRGFWIAEHGKEGSPFPYSGNLYKW